MFITFRLPSWWDFAILLTTLALKVFLSSFLAWGHLFWFLSPLHPCFHSFSFTYLPQLTPRTFLQPSPANPIDNYMPAQAIIPFGLLVLIQFPTWRSCRESVYTHLMVSTLPSQACIPACLLLVLRCFWVLALHDICGCHVPNWTLTFSPNPLFL